MLVLNVFFFPGQVAAGIDKEIEATRKRLAELFKQNQDDQTAFVTWTEAAGEAQIAQAATAALASIFPNGNPVPPAVSEKPASPKPASPKPASPKPASPKPASPKKAPAAAPPTSPQPAAEAPPPSGPDGAAAM